MIAGTTYFPPIRRLRRRACGLAPTLLIVLALALVAPLPGVAPSARADLLGLDQLIAKTKYGPPLKVLQFLKKAYGEGKNLTAECDCWDKFLRGLLRAVRDDSAAELALILDDCFALGNINENAPAFVAQDMLKAMNANPEAAINNTADVLGRLNEYCLKRPEQAASGGGRVSEPTPEASPPAKASTPPGIDEAACPRCVPAAQALKARQGEWLKAVDSHAAVTAKMVALQEPIGRARRKLGMLRQDLAEHAAKKQLAFKASQTTSEWYDRKWALDKEIEAAEDELRPLERELSRLREIETGLKRDLDRLYAVVVKLQDQLAACNRACKKIDEAGAGRDGGGGTSSGGQTTTTDFQQHLGDAIRTRMGLRPEPPAATVPVEPLPDGGSDVREWARRATRQRMLDAETTAPKPEPAPASTSASPAPAAEAPPAATTAPATDRATTTSTPAPATNTTSPTPPPSTTTATPPPAPRRPATTGTPPPRPPVETIYDERCAHYVNGRLVYEGACQ